MEKIDALSRYSFSAAFITLFSIYIILLKKGGFLMKQNSHLKFPRLCGLCCLCFIMFAPPLFAQKAPAWVTEP